MLDIGISSPFYRPNKQNYVNFSFMFPFLQCFLCWHPPEKRNFIGTLLLFFSYSFSQSLIVLCVLLTLKKFFPWFSVAKFCKAVIFSSLVTLFSVYLFSDKFFCKFDSFSILQYKNKMYKQKIKMSIKKVISVKENLSQYHVNRTRISYYSCSRKQVENPNRLIVGYFGI